MFLTIKKLNNFSFHKARVANSFLFIIFLAFAINTEAQNNSKNNDGSINGTIILDSTWSPKIYLSHIPSFSKMYTMSKSMIIAETDVDSLGFFNFEKTIINEE